MGVHHACHIICVKNYRLLVLYVIFPDLGHSPNLRSITFGGNKTLPLKAIYVTSSQDSGNPLISNSSRK